MTGMYEVWYCKGDGYWHQHLCRQYDTLDESMIVARLLLESGWLVKIIHYSASIVFDSRGDSK